VNPRDLLDIPRIFYHADIFVAISDAATEILTARPDRRCKLKVIISILQPCPLCSMNIGMGLALRPEEAGGGRTAEPLFSGDKT
jgi:hypothetical protein